MIPVPVRLPDLLEIFFPSLCVLCTTPLDGEKAVCGRCLETLAPTGLGPWLDETAVREGLDEVWSAFWYDETMQSLIHLFKYSGHRRVGRRLGGALFHQLEGEVSWGRFDALVPIPLHRTKRRERGYNQSAVLARTLGELSGLPMMERLVVRHRWTRSQTGLSVDERRTNVDGSFRATGPGGGRKVLLVDDVLTSGATVSACALALKAVGFGEVTALTVATPLKEK